MRNGACWALVLGVCACGTNLPDGDDDGTTTTLPGPGLEPDRGDGSKFEPQTGGVPWNGISWVGMPWHLAPTDALGLSGYPSDGVVALDTSAVNGLHLTGDGRQILQYLSKCALPAGAKLVVEIDDVVHEFPGVLNLAPGWVERPINDEEKAWVSACVLLLVNPTGVHVEVSPRGPHPALEGRIGSNELEEFPYQEAAFYGDIFASPPKAYVCVGADLDADTIDTAGVPGVGMGLSSEMYISYRVCAREDCGIRHTGDCFDAFAPHACTEPTDSVSGYDSCHDELAVEAWPPESIPFNAVMTSNLKEEDAEIFRTLAQDAALPN